jgi:hypothetical protein
VNQPDTAALQAVVLLRLEGFEDEGREEGTQKEAQQ